MNTALIGLIIVITAVLAYNIGVYYGQKELEDSFEIISKERDYYKYTRQDIIENEQNNNLDEELSDSYRNYFLPIREEE